MGRLLRHRVAPALLIAQIAYIAFIGLLLSGPDTAEIDHNAPSVADDVLTTGLLLLVVLVMGGGAALLGRKEARAWAPPAVRGAWLGLLGLGEIAIAAAFLNAARQESFGPDTVVAALAVAVSAAITAACAGEARHALRSPGPAPQG
ncbi:hypothetical protein PUR34_27315 [Streptomyces sp. JV185]|uniref:hypothetical protein n=1 Tax=Streptomyces sp. JV185 TaxID=858638 RepID=UPI002E799CDD|nr:hypothetical protein [Streptomyces sp. JV185]MEE1771765.1 hypothetical protein [Streptomyces sp. JV185]